MGSTAAGTIPRRESRTYHLTNAALRAAANTSRNLVPAPGAGLAIVVNKAVLALRAAGRTAFTIPGSTSLALRYTNSGGGAIASIGANANLNGAVNKAATFRPNANIAIVENAELIWHLNNQLTAGTGEAYLTVDYEIVRVG